MNYVAEELAVLLWTHSGNKCSLSSLENDVSFI
jgi:hypothetical protein